MVSDYCLSVSHAHDIYILFKILPPSFTLALFYFLISLLLLQFVVSFVGFTCFNMLKNFKTCIPHVTFEILTEFISAPCNLMTSILVEMYRSFGRRNFWSFSPNWVFFRLSTQSYPQNGGSSFCRNVCEFLPEYTAFCTLHI